jgi:site-specific DNA-methyltransferase (adenine-specific)
LLKALLRYINTWWIHESVLGQAYTDCVNKTKPSNSKSALMPFLNKVIEGDCIESLKKLPDSSVDMIFADPPYFMQTEGVLLRSNGEKFAGIDDDWDKFADYEEYDAFTNAWLKECKRVLTPNGSIWVIGAFQNIYRVGYIMQNLGFWILNDVVWSKPNAVPNFGGTRFQNSHETMLWCTKDQKSKYTFNYKTMKEVNGGKQHKSVWDIGICIGSERIKGADGKKAHPTQKPEQLLYKVILSSTKPGDVVLDPFFGTGTTGAMAKRLGRNFIGLDNSLEYISVAEKRISEEVVQLDYLSKLELEVKPPRVSMLTLIESGKLLVGEELFDKKGNSICSVAATGYVVDETEELSIHKMSAKSLKLANNNGWDYFFVFREGKLKPINDFRYEYEEEQSNETI